MAASTAPSRGVLRLLHAMARTGAVAEADVDESGAVAAVRVVRLGGGPTPDVLHRAGREVWHEAIATGLVSRAADGRWVPVAGARDLVVQGKQQLERAHSAKETARGKRALLAGSRGADAAEAARPARPLENIAESPLGWLRRRRDRAGQSLISDIQFEAGERLRTDFELGELAPRVTIDWAALGSGQSRRSGGGAASIELRDGVVAARERVGRALAAVGPEMARVLFDVCCHLKGLEQLEREAGWPQRSGKVVLQLALDALARHYGMGQTGAGAGVIRHWAPGDYRPSIGGER